jgi:hypothetical protein
MDDVQLADRNGAYLPMYSNHLNLKAIFHCPGDMDEAGTTPELSEKNHYLRG